MRLKTPIAAPFLIAVSLAGCLDQTGLRPGEETPGTPPDDPEIPALGLDRPQWRAGHWWQGTMEVDFGFGVTQEHGGKFVVARADPSGYLVAADSRELSSFDAYFDQFSLGRFDSALNASVAGASFQLYSWPLVPGASWTTRVPIPSVGQDSIPVYNATLEVQAFDEEWDGASQRLRIMGSTEHGEVIEYDYSALTGWMTYFRLVNETAGSILLSLDFGEHGEGFRGTVHTVVAQPLYERYAGFPCDEEQNCDVRWLGLPPAESVSVDAGPHWVETISFLFTFPLPIVGASEAAVLITTPDMEKHNVTHTGATDRFSFTFDRHAFTGNAAGQWHVALQSAGTGGAFVAIFGLEDAEVVL